MSSKRISGVNGTVQVDLSAFTGKVIAYIVLTPETALAGTFFAGTTNINADIVPVTPLALNQVAKISKQTNHVCGDPIYVTVTNATYTVDLIMVDYDDTEVKDSLDSVALGLVGWRETTNSTISISSVNQASRSGLYYQGASGIITPETLKDSQSDPDMDNDEFNTFLENLSKDGLNDVVRGIFPHGEVIETKTLFPHPDNWKQFNENEGDFVGFRFMAPKGNHAIRLNWVQLEFDADDFVTLYLFHSSKTTPIWSKTFEVTALDAVTQNIDLTIRDEYGGGCYLLGYFTTGTAKGLKRSYQLSNVQSRYLLTSFVPVKAKGHTSIELPDLELVENESNSWGLNFSISGIKDFSKEVIDNQYQFAKSLQLAVGCRVLDIIATTSRANQKQRVMKPEAMLALDGNRLNKDLPYSVGLNETFRKELTRLKVFFADPVQQRGTLR